AAASRAAQAPAAPKPTTTTSASRSQSPGTVASMGPPSSADGKTVTCSSMDEVDVVVAGSGAAGMTAALTAAHLGLSVLVIEKAGSFGGSTARSGGGIWAPGNSVLRAAGVADTPEQARAYLAHVAEEVPAARREALLEYGPEMLGLVLAKTPVRFAWVPGYADYYPEAPGGLSAGRSIEPVPLDGRQVLGAELDHLARPAGGQRRAGLAGHPAGGPRGSRRPGDRGARHAGRGTAADPGPAGGADRHRRLRARRADAPPVPARADRDRVDDRRGREHRR